MKNKTKGFTLIELLAVILILGIIALIAIPTVSKIIYQSKKEAFEATTNNIVIAIENRCQIQELKGEAITSTYTFSGGVASPSLDIKGDLPTIGTAMVDSSCNVKINVSNGEFSAIKTLSAESVTVVNGYANGTAVYFNPVTGAKCTAGEAVSTTGTKTGCMKWYTFNDNGTSSNTINLILDHNTSASVLWNSTGSSVNGPTNVLTKLQTDTSSWLGVPTRTDSYSVNDGTSTYTINYNTYRARLITAAEIAAITGNSSFVEATTLYTNWFYFDSNNQTQTATTTGESNYDWLFDYTNDCTNYGCNITDNSTFGYWTSTAVSGITRSAWRVFSNGYMSNLNVDNDDRIGVRPVITILKSNL